MTKQIIGYAAIVITGTALLVLEAHRHFLAWAWPIFVNLIEQ